MTNKTIDKLFFLLFLGPGLILYLVFYYYPNISSLFFAFFNWNLAELEKSRFVGFKFFMKLYEDSDIILKCMGNNVYFSLFGMVLSMALALIICGLVTSSDMKKSLDTKVYRSVMYFPNIVPPVATAMMWTFIYSPIYGITSPFFKFLGFSELADIPLLGNTATVKPAILVYGLWGSVGFYFIIILAAMSNIPNHFYEASSIDGASKLIQFFKITLPLISGTIRTLVLLGVANLFSGGFIAIQIMTGGGPNRASEILTSYMYQQSFGNGIFGYGAAIGTMIFVLTLVLYIAFEKILSRSATYEY